MATINWKSKEQMGVEARDAQVESLRQKRDQELRGTDYLMLPDAPITAEERAEFVALRAGLRDLTESVANAPEWAVGVTYIVGEPVIYQGGAYIVLQGHTSQADWTPDEEEALFRWLGDADLILADSTAPLPWVKPTGAHDAYNIGDRVTFEGAVYESTIDANVYSPTEYPAGWSVV